MGVKLAAAVAALICLSSASVRAAPPPPAALPAPPAGPTLDIYGALPTVSDVELSPDGSRLALVVGPPSNRQLQVRNTSDLSPILATVLGEVKVRALLWAGDHHLVVVSSVTARPSDLEGPKREYYLAADVDVDKRKLNRLMTDAKRSLKSVGSIPIVLTVKGKPMIFVEGSFFPEERSVVALYRIDPETDQSKMISEGSEDTEQILAGPDGEAVARSSYIQKTGRWALSLRLNGTWKEIYDVTAPIDHPSIVGLGHDGRSVLVETREGEGWGMREANLKDGAWSDPIEALDGKTVISDPLTRAAIGGTTEDMTHTIYTFLKSEDQAAWDAVARAFPKEEVELASWSDDRKHIVVKVEGARDGAGYFVVDLNTKHAAWLADEYEGLGPELVAETRAIEYAAQDGLTIPAYLTLPKGRPAKGLPLVVLVHGGPAARDDPGFDWWSQALASRGYAVLQPQYRGSTGFEIKYMNAGFGQWGRKMQTDLSDGVRDLVKQGLVDPKRVCIMGASYGGYAALAGAVFDPSAYRCAIDLAGPSDLRRFLSYERDLGNGYNQETVRYWDRFMGAKSPTDPALDDISPALHADKAAIPILLIQGQDDTVVPYDQSKRMADALKRAGKPAELVTLKSEDHWLSRGDTRRQMLNAAVAFLEAHNPPG
jgi:dipeptidyl aminopeptidase/acylaminoacyl peptidase